MMQTKKHTRATRSATSGEQMRKPVMVIIKAVTFGLLATTVLLLLFSFAFCQQDLPFSLTNPLSAFSLLVGAFISGYLAARSFGQRGLMIGASCGAGLFLILLVASLQGTAQIDWTALLKLAISSLAGAIGGVTGVNRKKTSHRIKSKRKENGK